MPSLGKVFGSRRAALYRELLRRGRKFLRELRDPELNVVDTVLEAEKTELKDLPLGSRERKKAVDDLYGRLYRKQTVKEVSEGLKETKGDLRHISDEALEGLYPVVPPQHPLNIGTQGSYRPDKNLIKLNYEMLTGGKRAPTVAHEIAHHIQNKEGLLRDLGFEGHTEKIEAEAAEFAEWVRKRSEGKAGLKDVPQKFLPYILGLVGALDQKREERE